MTAVAFIPGVVVFAAAVRADCSLILHQPYRALRQLIGVTGDILGSSRRSAVQHRTPLYKTMPSDVSAPCISLQLSAAPLFLVHIHHCILRLDYAARATVIIGAREGSYSTTLERRLWWRSVRKVRNSITGRGQRSHRLWAHPAVCSVSTRDESGEA